MKPETRAVRSSTAVFVSIIAVIFIAAACGAAASPTPAPPTAVAVTLQEWAVIPDTTTIKAGEVTFNATNAGPDDPHELVVIKTDLGLLSLPTGADGKVDEQGAGLTVIGEIAEFAVGAKASGTLTLTPGKYLLICNVLDAEGDAHYGKGMTIAVTVE